MNKKLQCQKCGKAEYGEDLYNYDGEILCRYCIVAKVFEGLTPCEYIGICNDKTCPSKDQQIDQLKHQLAEKEKEIEFIKYLGNYKTTTEMFKENAKLIIEKRQLVIQELEKVKVNLKDRITMMSNEEHSYLQKVVIWYDICNQVNKQIKELKGGD